MRRFYDAVLAQCALGMYVCFAELLLADACSCLQVLLPDDFAPMYAIGVYGASVVEDDPLIIFSLLYLFCEPSAE